MSNIQWTNLTCNPIHLVKPDGRHGGHWCRKVSPGCARCYSETQNQSNYFKFASHLSYSGSAPDNLIFDEKVMQELIKMRSPKKVFLCSMTDLFGEWVLDEWIDQIWAYMAIASHHTFQILTKRPERMREYFSNPIRGELIRNRALYLLGNKSDPIKTRFKNINFTLKLPLSNCWLGVSVENQKAADDRIPSLLQTPAAIRFLSCEPLLGRIDLRKYLGICVGCQSCDFQGGHRIGKSMLNWAIIGGESGSDARACETNWIKSIVYQCQKAETAVFVKQLGSNPVNSAHLKFKTNDRKGGNIDDFPPELRVRQFPE
ncbi:DUF5131 family protein [Microcoleus sp. B9-D4]|uniref:DUF5131 family protein n=1 Tax=Microcoleus sp. B9-D4 TaxID=2818711 RepID=UPI002FD6DEFD